MRWVQWFTAGGVARLAGLLHDWSTPRLAKAQEEAFRQLLARQFGVAYSLNGVYDLLKRLGLVWMSARALKPYADPVAQAEFKKTSLPKSCKRCPRHCA